MGRVFIPAQDAKTVPVVRRGIYEEDQTFIKGAVLGFREDTSELIELDDGADLDADTIVGVALEDVESAPGYNVANDNQVAWRTGTEQAVSYVDLIKQPLQIFSGRFTDDAGDDVAPTQANIGLKYGLLRLASGEWVVNSEDVTNEQVVIVDIVLNLGAAAAGNYVLFKFDPAFIGTTPVAAIVIP